MGLAPDVVEKAVDSFQGVERRLQVLGTAQETVFLSDFAHHPTAIAQVLGGLPGSYPGRKVIAVFEPRSWSLRRNFFQDRLPDALAHADEIVIKDVYEKEKIPAGERLSLDRVRSGLEALGKKVHVFPAMKRSSPLSGRWTSAQSRWSFSCPTATCGISAIGCGTFAATAPGRFDKIRSYP